MTAQEIDFFPTSSSSSSSSSSNSSDSEESVTLKKNTVYERIRLIYYRNNKDYLNYRTFKGFEISQALHIGELLTKKNIKVNKLLKTDYEGYTIWESSEDSEFTSGIITENFSATDFDLWIIQLVIDTSKIKYSIPHTEFKKERYTDLITEKFNSELKNHVDGDQWEAIGRSVFFKNVDFFTSRWKPLEAVLPAFPCKSSNVEKVSGQMPDKGEELALRRLINFSRSIQKVYPPGLIIWIVSDGHVFSDCIGVDDLMVNKYTIALKELYAKVSKELNFDCIKFSSLPDIFSLRTSEFNEDIVADVELEHHLGTCIDKESETCRKILVTACDTDDGQLKKDINTPEHSRLYLFRGFSKFMTEDLELHPKVAKMSRKKFKKLVAKVAFEMIKRNDAYSNLVELIFPFHLRLSIHSHINSGPKFGIALLSKQGPEKCQVIKKITDHKQPATTDFLHIPTPWHNSIVKINNQDTFFVIKSIEVKEELDKGKGVGGWDSSKLHYTFVSK
ncbi:putative spore wall maturation protein [Scheffersomyces amazonensis]|uniref:putative spore wall maturation protein n=1 Tax=Scheffersomyces amazonensis TaxID=1078765 RepID=UPI00315D35E6